MSQENLKEKPQCFNEVLFYKVVVAWNSSELPEQKEGLFFLLLPLRKQDENPLLLYLNKSLL